MYNSYVTRMLGLPSLTPETLKLSDTDADWFVVGMEEWKREWK